MSNRFVFICPTFNAEHTARQCVLSMAAQSYQNWHAVVIDDMSTDDTARTILQLFDRLGIKERLTCVFNKEKKWEIENTLIGLSRCSDEDIVCRLDMDDYLIDNTTLEILDRVYASDDKIDAAWTAHRWFDDKHGLTSMNISAQLPSDADPYRHPWVSSHFKTFRKRLLTGVNDANFRSKDGKYFRRIGDQAFYLPALHNARKRVFVPLVAYAYRCSLEPQTFQTDDAKFQASEAEFLRSRGYVK